MMPESPYGLSDSMGSIASNLAAVVPEIVLVFTFLITVLIGVLAGKARKLSGPVAIAGVLVAGLLAVIHVSSGQAPVAAFSGMISMDRLGSVFKLVVYAAAGISMWVGFQSRKLGSESEGIIEYFMLTVAAVIGLSFLVMSRHLMMVFLSLEMVSLPSYILTAYSRRSRASSESSLKYVIFGSFSSGIMAYGISWMYGLTGTLDPSSGEMMNQLAAHPVWVQAFVVLLILAGMVFKVGAFPFHFWVPDVYEGAPYPVAAFFSVGPKVAGFLALLRFLSVFQVEEVAAFQEVIVYAIAVLALGSMFVGNLSALFQPRMRRLLAYSSIAHSGYILVALAAMSPAGESAAAFYLIVYSLMTFGAFLVAGWLIEHHGSESLDDLKGLGGAGPLMAVIVVVLMVSLAGLPPTAGFIAKLQVFLSLFSGNGQGVGALDILLMLAVVVNTVIGLFYYLRPPVQMIFKNPGISSKVSLHGFQGGVLVVLTISLLVFGVFAFDACINLLSEFVKEIHVDKRF